MAAPCAASEVVLSLRADSNIRSHVASLHTCVQVRMHIMNSSCASIDLILEASFLPVSLVGRQMNAGTCSMKMEQFITNQWYKHSSPIHFSAI